MTLKSSCNYVKLSVKDGRERSEADFVQKCIHGYSYSMKELNVSQKKKIIDARVN